jgi:hypothetical protein
MHRRTAAGTIGVFGLDRHIDARQMRWKCAAIGPTHLGTRASSNWVSLVLVRLGGGDGLLDILEGQRELVRIKLLRTPAKLHALQLVQQMLQATVLRLHVIALLACHVALDQRSITFRSRCHEQRSQRFDIGRQLIGALAHADHGIRFACRREAQGAA